MAEINEVMNVPTMYDRDLVLQGLFPVKREEEELTEECGGIELSLGLSLNGKFGVDPRAKKLMRSSSVATFGDNNEADAATAAFSPPVACGTLARTCSLPVETEEEVRRRKELQTLRRMEAKRKRDEKQRNLRAARENWEECSLVKLGNGNQQNSKVPAELSPPRGSIASQGSGSSGISEPGSPPVQGSSKQSGIPRHPSALSLLHQNEQQQVLGAAAAGDEPPVIEKGTKTSPAAGNTTLNMPYVSTKGDGPNGKRVEGFLYQYRKGEEVRIVCVCHGSFLSPADFVKHAGGEDVEYPLKHILVNPSSFL